jgi:hypothetical protein
VTLANVWGAESFVFNNSIWHCTSLLQNNFKWKTYHIRAGINEYINTITFGLILLIHYSCFNLDWLYSCAIHFKFACGFIFSGLQIDFRWKTCFIHAGNKDHIREDLIWLRNKNTVLLWILCSFEELNRSFLMFAYPTVHSILQIDFN